MIKKIIAGALSAAIAVSVLPTAVFAEYGSNIGTITTSDTPDASIFDDSGTVHDRAAWTEWAKEGTPDVLAHKMLDGNVAFVTKTSRFWNKTAVETAAGTPYFDENGKMVIPAEAFGRALGVTVSGDYITEEEALKAAPGWQAFTDTRGFMIFSKNIDTVINKAPAIENNIAWRHYRSYYDVQIAMAYISWTDVKVSADNWKALRNRARIAMTLPAGDLDDYGERYINEIADNVKKYVDNVDTTSDGTTGFVDTGLYASFQHLLEMTQLYAMMKDKNYTVPGIDRKTLRTKLLSVFELLADEYIGKNKSLDSNWYFNRITYPQTMAQCMILLWDELDPSYVKEVAANCYVRYNNNLVGAYSIPFKRYTNGAEGEPTNAYSNYTNLLWQTVTGLMIAACAENENLVNNLMKYAAGVFEEVTNSTDNEVAMIKDGVYEDGSFVFHSWYAYNMGYGYSLIGTIGPLVALTDGLPFDIQRLRGFDTIYSWIEKAWMPFIYSNARMRITVGREKASGLSGKGNVMVKSLLMFAAHSHSKTGKEEIERQLKPLVDQYYDEYMNYERIPIMQIYVHPAANAEIQTELDYVKNDVGTKTVKPYNNMYYNMDKAVHKRDAFTFMLSMCSDRISNYEAINNEGYTDWYTANGMTYLLMDDEQYKDSWWEYVDRYCMPGTTVDTQKLNSTYSNYGTVLPNNKWAGGASDGMIAVGGMEMPSQIQNRKANITGKKSYFMLDNEIVCMGTGISGGTGEVSTIVENYLDTKAAPENANATRKDGYTEVVVDGESLPFEFDKRKDFDGAKYVSLNNDRGWVFFDTDKISVMRAVDRKGYTGSGKEETKEGHDVPFVTVKAEHGTDPKNASYGYVILPNRTAEQVAEYAGSMSFTVVEQSDKRHEILLKDGTIMANLFEPGVVDGITFKNRCSVIIRPVGDCKRVYVSDPTQSANTLFIGLPDNGGVTGERLTLANKTVEINAGANYGKTFSFLYVPEGAKDGDIWSAEAEGEGNGKIKTWSLKIKSSLIPLSTKLYAQSEENSDVTFEAVDTESLKGRVYVEGDRLYWLPPTGSEPVQDAIKIRATDAAGNTADFTVTVNAG